MDPIVHTVIALACIGAGYALGRWHGFKKGVVSCWAFVADAVGATELNVEDGSIMKKDMQGNQSKVR